MSPVEDTSAPPTDDGGELPEAEDTQITDLSEPEETVTSDATSETTDVAPEEIVEQVETTVDLIDNGAWIVAPAEEDPWVGDGSKASDELCEPDSYQLEFTPDGEWFEVDTSFCGYLTVRQGLPLDLPEGATITVQIDHEVVSEGAGPYTLAIGMGSPGASVWETLVPVPSLENVLDGSWVTTQPYVTGDPVLFHISNHGANNWALRTLRATFLIPVSP